MNTEKINYLKEAHAPDYDLAEILADEVVQAWELADDDLEAIIEEAKAENDEENPAQNMSREERYEYLKKFAPDFDKKAIEADEVVQAWELAERTLKDHISATKKILKYEETKSITTQFFNDLYAKMKEVHELMADEVKKRHGEGMPTTSLRNIQSAQAKIIKRFRVFEND